MDAPRIPTVALVAGACLQAGILERWEHFIEEAEAPFQKDEAVLDESKGTTFSLGQREIHREFEAVVEADLSKILQDLSLDADVFMKVCGQSVEGKAGDGNSDLAAEREAFQVFAQLVLSATDFQIFADIIKDKNKRAYYFGVMRSWCRALK